ncbi:MAG: mannose/fructose/N-acetylgalactosamine-specific phosphotransferase system component IIB [Flavobacteriaceae bacterium]|jgi:mannose/fructose/N-acetylgalactosamine-specific phosphotransferase system component IIB
MNLNTVYLTEGSKFSTFIGEWAQMMEITVAPYSFKASEDQLPDGLLLINENQDIRKDMDEIHTHFDTKHIPTQKIDLNGTLQVAINNIKRWVESNKCKEVLIIGADNVVKNENLVRFLKSI